VAFRRAEERSVETEHERSDAVRAETTNAAESDLQASAALFVSALERATELERRKTGLPPGDEQREQLAREIQAITLDLVSRGRYQSRLIQLEEQILDPRPDERLPEEVLEEWRAAERRLHEARLELEHASDAADRLRDEHRRAAGRGRQP
jgi:hypothetical protein